MPTFNILDQPSTMLSLAAQSLTFLTRNAVFAKTGVTMFQDGSFEKGETVSISRPKDSGDAEDYDPYTNSGATENQPGNVIVKLSLDRLFTKGFPIYSSDSSINRYVQEYSESNSNSVRRSSDNYFYDRAFIDMSTVGSAGTYAYGADAPIAVIWNETATGVLTVMQRSHLTKGNAYMKRNEVPAPNRFAVLSPDSVEDLFENAPTDEGRVGSLAGGVGLLADGLQEGEFINRHGFAVGNSNAIASQEEVTDVVGGNPSVGISTVVDDTTIFFKDDYADPTPLGAVLITLDTVPLSGNVAVGQVVRIGVDGGTAKAYGRILRIDPTRVSFWVVPYDSRGRQIKAAQITPGTDLVRIPQINNLNTAYHSEHLVYATRKLAPPSDGSGARMSTVVDQNLGLALQYLRGDYQVDKFKEAARVSLLCGAVATDYRKAALLLTA